MNSSSRLRRGLEESKMTPILSQIIEEPEYSEHSDVLSNRAENSIFEPRPDKFQPSEVAPPRTFQYSTNAYKVPMKPFLREEKKKFGMGLFESEVFGSETPQTNIIKYPKLTQIHDLKECCVTVFGFMPSQKEEIVKEMENCGRILEYKWKGKNWMHIKYSQVNEAIKAMELHGKYISSHFVLLKKVVQLCDRTDYCTDGVLDNVGRSVTAYHCSGRPHSQRCPA